MCKYKSVILLKREKLEGFGLPHWKWKRDDEIDEKDEEYKKLNEKRRE